MFIHRTSEIVSLDYKTLLKNARSLTVNNSIFDFFIDDLNSLTFNSIETEGSFSKMSHCFIFTARLCQRFLSMARLATIIQGWDQSPFLS